MTPHRTHRHRALLALAALLPACMAHAEDHGGTRLPPVPPLPAYRQECAACHVAFPPALLPAESWQRLMGQLPRHFGADASLDAAATRTLSAWLMANAGTQGRVRKTPPEDRITKSAWFVREHAEVPTPTWKRTSVKSPANCQACHAQADQGDFNEHDVRIPR